MAQPSALMRKLQAYESEMSKAKADIDRIEEEKRRGLNISNIKALNKRFKETCDKTKRETQISQQKQSIKKKPKSTRSGRIRGKPKESTCSDGIYISRGMDHALQTFTEEDKEFIKSKLAKCKEVHQLELDHIKYLVCDMFLDDLKKIQAGKLKSRFHDRYHELKGRTNDLLSDVRTGLFTNKQRDYINGLLQGAFKTTCKGDDGHIKYLEIKYTETVMYAETIIRIVKFVHKLESNEEAFEYTIKRSRESLGLEDDDDDL